MYVSTHSLARQRLVARDSAKGPCVQRMVVAGGRRGTPLCAATTTSGLQVDDLGVAVYWALGTYQGGGVLGSMGGGAQKE